MATFLFSQASPSAPAEGLHLSKSDEEAIRHIGAAYVQAWLANDPAAVLSLFWPDAVIVPQGREPIIGAQQMASFWWPAGGGKTMVTTFTNTAQEVGGSGNFAFSRGTYSFTFDYELEGRVQKLANRGNYIMLFRRDDNGRWKISHRMWSDLPRR